MVWLITGASGQLGLAMQRELSARRLPFLAMDSKKMNVTDQHSVEEVFLASNPEFIVNCAAWTDVNGAEDNPEMAHQVNALGPKNLAVASKKIGAKLIHISTDYVFSGDGEIPWPESAKMHPASKYGLSKRDGENFVQEFYADGSYIMRTAWLYSANGKNFVKTLLSLGLENDSEIRVVNDQFGQPTSANDLSRHIIDLVIHKSRPGIYHGTNSGQATWFELSQEIFALAGFDVERLIPVSSDEFPSKAQRPKYSVLGHGNWDNINMSKMRDWRLALADEIPTILSTIRQVVQ